MEFTMQTLAFLEANRQSQDHRQQIPRGTLIQRSLNLPGELRNNMYERMAEDDILFVNPGQGTDAFSLSSLYSVQLQRQSQQVCKEYAFFACAKAPTISTAVTNLDFPHVMAFLDHVSRQEQKTRGLTDNSKRRIVAHLDITGACVPSFSSLVRWLERFVLGINYPRIEFEYHCPRHDINNGTNYAKQVVRIVERHLGTVDWTETDSLLETAWPINALNNPGFQRRIRSDDLASYVESGVPFPTRLGDVQCLISRAQRRRMIGSIEQAIQEFQDIFHRLADMVREQSEDLKRLAEKEGANAVPEE